MATSPIFEVYSSSWLHGFGRFIAIITVQAAEAPNNILAEVFLLAPDTEDVFEGSIMEYRYHEGDERYGKFDFEFMRNEAVNQAKCLIQRCQSNHYRQNKDAQVFSKMPDLVLCGKTAVAIIRENATCMKHLQDIAKDTRSETLKDLIRDLLSQSRIQIRDYKR